MTFDTSIIDHEARSFRTAKRDFGLAAERVAQALDQIARVPGALDLLVLVQKEGGLDDHGTAAEAIAALMRASSAERRREGHQTEMRDAVRIAIMGGTVATKDEVQTIDDWSRFLKKVAEDIVAMPAGERRDTAARTLVLTAHDCGIEATLGAVNMFMRGGLSQPIGQLMEGVPHLREALGRAMGTLFSDRLPSVL